MNDTPRSWSAALAWSIGFVPMLYALGFVAWSSYFRARQLGFHSLPPAQYLIAGLLFLTMFGPMLLLEAGFQRQGWLDAASRVSKNGILRQLALGFIRATLFAFLFSMLHSIYSALGIMTIPGWGTTIYGWGIGLLVAVANLLVLIMTGIYPYIMWLPTWLLNKLPLPEIEIPDTTAHSLAKVRKAVLLGVPVLSWLLVGTATFGYLLLETVNPEFGGATPQTAILGVDQDSLPPELRFWLIDPAKEPTGFAWTRPVYVLVLGQDTVMFRIQGPQQGPLYEISKDIVTAIQWDRPGTSVSDI